MAAARALTDHDEIRRWAEQRGATPACVRGAGGKGDTPMIRLDFPDYSGSETLQPISWREWFAAFDESRLALIVQDRTARRPRRRFNNPVGGTAAERKPRPARTASRGRTTDRARMATSRARLSPATGGRTKTTAKRRTAGRKRAG
jgi:hypothetical protein